MLGVCWASFGRPVALFLLRDRLTELCLISVLASPQPFLGSLPVTLRLRITHQLSQRKQSDRQIREGRTKMRERLPGARERPRHQRKQVFDHLPIERAYTELPEA